MARTDRQSGKMLAGYGHMCGRAKPPIYDQDSLVLKAVTILSRSPIRAEYDAVIVDEAQDLTAAGLQLLLHLVGDGPKGRLFLSG